jgi:hypothetical protein
MTAPTDPPPAARPCPFCGSARLSTRFEIGLTSADPDLVFIQCTECKANGPRVETATGTYGDDRFAVAGRTVAELWNRRHPHVTVSPADREPAAYYATLKRMAIELAALTDPVDIEAKNLEIMLYRLSSHTVYGKDVG